jgi:hypothetical protein
MTSFNRDDINNYHSTPHHVSIANLQKIMATGLSLMPCYDNSVDLSGRSLIETFCIL